MRDVNVTCGCGRHYDAASWPELPLCGHMDDGEGGLLELRNCPCGSTRAIEVATDERSAA